MKAALLALLLTGCAMPFYQQMSPEQLAALAKIKEANVGCIRGLYAGATITTVWVSTDKNIVGGVSIDQECKVQFMGVQK